MGGVRVRAWNYRGLTHLDWSPDGVCLLAGPNGSGKSTVLQVLRFLRNARLRGVAEAIRFSGGASALRNLRAHPDADVVVEITIAETSWRLEIPIEGDGVGPYAGERVTHAGRIVLDVPKSSPTFILQEQQRQRGERAELDTLLTIEPSPWLQAFCDAVAAIRVYDDFDVSRRPEPVAVNDSDAYLHPTGKNLFTVLRNWKVAPRQYRGQFTWVLDRVRAAFPSLIDDLEFTPDGRAWIYPTDAPHPDARLPVHLEASGLITALMQLTAIAGAKRGSVVGFDEMENQLHPHAIRLLITAMRERAEALDLVIVLTTHSPVVMNEFKGSEQRFFVLERGADGAVPTVLTEVRDADWLAHFALGDLYEREEFGSPRAEAG